MRVPCVRCGNLLHVEDGEPRVTLTLTKAELFKLIRWNQQSPESRDDPTHLRERMDCALEMIVEAR